MYWCLGIRGSGSTWVYNAVRKVGLALASGKPSVEAYVVRLADLPSPADGSSLVFVKSHVTDEACANELSRRSRAIWISIRDPRDCVTSLKQYHGLAFEAALQAVELDAHFCAHFVAHPLAAVFRYEAGFADDLATLDRIAEGFGSVLTAADRTRIFAEMRRSAIEGFIKELDKLPTTVRPRPGALVDTVTQWHEHHANRTGESGRWRRLLTGDEAAQIECRLGTWMRRFGYATEVASTV